ncbi:hypothetical protein FGO68_gene13442 [Halteria grandinella]|uniref:Cadherin domain-containing protein n=1 Tax=Halteria grandinella TaxID=5974 RepID=A0A8J8T9A3_HALGN|nr:hypothetical protein FGO68_gene13442 [Halteria grandinella]
MSHFTRLLNQNALLIVQKYHTLQGNQNSKLSQIQYNLIIFIMLKLAICLIFLQLRQYITTRPAFPKIFGTSVADATFTSLAFHEDSNLIVSGGMTRENSFGLVELSSFVVAYKGTDFPWLWAKIFDSKMNVNELQLSPDGNTLAAFARENWISTGDKIFIINPLTGVRYSSITIPGLQTPWVVFVKLQVLSGTFPASHVIVAMLDSTYRDHLYKITTSASVIWALKSNVDNNNNNVNQIFFGETESIIYRCGYTSPQSIVQRINAATGAPLRLQISLGCNQPRNRFATKYFSNTQQHMIVGICKSYSVQERRIWYILEDISNNAVIESKVYLDTTDITVGSSILATHIVNSQEIIALFASGIYMYIATINLQTLASTTQKTLVDYGQQYHWSDYSNIRFRSDGQTYYFSVYSGSKLYKDTSTFITIDPGYYKGVILSSNGLESCMSSASQQAYSGILTLQTTVPPTITSTTDLSSVSLSFSQSSISTTITILENQLANFDSQCTGPAELPKIYVLSEGSGVSSHTFYAAVATFTYSQVWFLATQTQGTTTAVPITYSITMSDGTTACPNWLTIDPATGLLTMTAASIVGTQSIMIKGTILTTQTITRIFSLIAVVNTPPTIDGSPASNTDVIQYQTSTISLSGTDSEGDALTLTVFEVGTATLPSFITYDGISKLLTIAPIGSTIVKEYFLRVSLVTAYHATNVDFKVTVLLNHPPSLLEIPPLVIDVSQASTYTLNLEGVDLENDSIILTVYEIGSSPLQLPSFMSYDGVLKELNISPILATPVTSYSIQVKLVTPQHTVTQDFSVNVIAYNNPPALVNALPAGLDVATNIQQSINLAAVDIDLDPITTTVFELGSSPQSLPNFMMFDPVTNILKILPSDSTIIQKYTIRIVLESRGYTIRSDLEVTVSAGINERAAILGVMLKNSAPPMFEEELPASINLIAGTQLIYNLPPIVDLDSDEYILTPNLGEAAIFTMYNDFSFTFSPTKAHIKKDSPYIIKLRLTDKNHAPKSLFYFLFVTVEAKQSQNQTQNTTQNSTAQSNTTNSTTGGQGVGVEVVPQRTISEAMEQGATIFNSTAEMIVYKADRFGVIKVLFIGQFLISDLIDKMDESDFSVTLASKGNKAIPFSIIDRNRRAGIIQVQLEFEDPPAISAGNEFDLVELSLKKELVISNGLRRRMLFGGGIKDVVKVLKINKGLSRVKAVPAQLSQGKKIANKQPYSRS